MDKNDPPRAFGVFKPSGHTVIAFRNEASLNDAVEALVRTGFPESALTIYTPEEMLTQSQSDIDNAGTLATVGQELNLVKVHHDIARRGGHFLVVETDDDEQAEKAAAVARQFGAELAQRYGKFMVEELIDPGNGKRQEFESPDRGLDNRHAH